MPVQSSPLASLTQKSWFKLITGASFQDLPQVYNLALAYTLAGADCIDVAADPAVIQAAQEGMDRAIALCPSQPRPLLMVSINDGEDPHFRKAWFNPENCPPDCPRPCVSICPAAAIEFKEPIEFEAPSQGVLDYRCYGCGRCLPICPIQQIQTYAQPASLERLAPLIHSGQVQALEIHTRPDRQREFSTLWQQVAPWQSHLQVLAISCPDGEYLLDYLHWIADLIGPLQGALIWQTDGRPMSGDIGDGTTRAAIQLGQKVLQGNLPGFVQLAGGTNGHTVAKLRAMGLLISPADQGLVQPAIAGVAYGSYARTLLAPFHAQSSQWHQSPSLLRQAVSQAATLVSQIKALPPSLWLNSLPDNAKLQTISTNS
ncbi:DUF561 domain-containing protein [Candidatus Synechococcus calcipolaris G9]|uniref:DUF561 domain-containing protein n=1 Tax=Candidatus Synechococcus calcipolaris G9 TaxID=1497997 RepID=A0ABT6F377_9SYNE|nr:DUF561 domain-containing protein [Candidatus Synechococcus calcipolaris]MDG2992307.1 DUF561 domain-containing protein [Candidatus Synechococcus calcipolaris G9]